MPSVTLKKIPSELYEKVKKSARQNHRSINSEILVCLEKVLSNRRVEPEEFLLRVQRIQEHVSLPRLTDYELRKAKEEGRP
jgi:hypothetical protein